MKIGIDVSQVAYEKTGVSEYLTNLIQNLVKIDKENEYVLFFSSMRRNLKSQISNLKSTNKQSLRANALKNVKIKTFRFPPIFLDLLWNKLHVIPIEWLIGPIDLFITSDWTEPPSKAKKATILYDLIVYKYPEETDSRIVETQKRKLKWVKKESKIIFSISESTKIDAMKILGIDKKKLKVLYPGA